MAFKKCFGSASLEDEYAKILFHEVNTCNVGRYDRVGLAKERVAAI